MEDLNEIMSCGHRRRFESIMEGGHSAECQMCLVDKLRSALWRTTHEALDLYGYGSEEAVQRRINTEMRISAASMGDLRIRKPKEPK